VRRNDRSHFCAQCGHSLARRWLQAEARERDVCPACHTVHYVNPKVLVACVAHWGDRIVLCRRAIEPAKGHWYLPAGFVEAGESLEEAAIREVREEVGLDLRLPQMLLYGLTSLPHLDEVYITYRAELATEPKLVPGPESLDAGLFSEAQIPAQLAFPETSRAFLQNFFAMLREGIFPVRCHTIGPGVIAAPRAVPKAERRSILAHRLQSELKRLKAC
jgi:ADP-ribose pyrophosphatase YjhB (NUDIX family)